MTERTGLEPATSNVTGQRSNPLTPFFHFPPEIRKIIYTTHAIESFNRSFREISCHRKLFLTIELEAHMPGLMMQCAPNSSGTLSPGYPFFPSG